MKEFKEKLIEFFEEEFCPSGEFCKKINECKDFSDIKDCLEESSELKELLGVDDLKDEIDGLEDEVDDLKGEIKELGGIISELEDELMDAKTFKPETYWDEEKYEIFLNFHHKFTPTQLEGMLK